MSSSTSSSEGWRGFFVTLLGVAAALAAVVYIAVVVVDPFDTLPMSPDLDRVPIATNARYSFPALARSAAFDSVVIGTSTSRLLRPESLDRLFGGRFANLAMNSATAYEQSRMLSLFARHHPHAQTVLIGVDSVWCGVGDNFERYTPRPFPEWMYDDNPLNDLRESFDFYTLEQAGRQLATLAGLRPVKYGRDGYTSFLPDPSLYDREKVRVNLWGEGPKQIVPVEPAVALDASERAALNFPTHGLMADALASLPEKTQKVLYFVPYHISAQPVPGSEDSAHWAECKARLAGLAATVPNTRVVDFMIPSAITARDDNYWDKLHYTVEIAEVVAEDLRAAANGRADSTRYRLMTAPR